MVGNLGKWTGHAMALEPHSFGRHDSYLMAAAWLDGHGTVYDFGCGTAWARQYFKRSPYVGVDGSPSAFCQVVADLAEFPANADCVLLRHVLEHDWRWQQILLNACLGFKRRMVLITFLPLTQGPTHSLWDEDPGGGAVPNLSINEGELLRLIGPYLVRQDRLPPDPLLRDERIFYLEKRG